MGILSEGEPKEGEVWLLNGCFDRGRLVKSRLMIDDTVVIISQCGGMSPSGALIPDHNGVEGLSTVSLAHFMNSFTKYEPEPIFRPGDILTDEKTCTQVFLYVSDEYVRRLDPHGTKVYDMHGYTRMYGPLVHVRHVGGERPSFNVLEALKNN